MGAKKKRPQFTVRTSSVYNQTDLSYYRQREREILAELMRLKAQYVPHTCSKKGHRWLVYRCDYCEDLHRYRRALAEVHETLATHIHMRVEMTHVKSGARHAEVYYHHNDAAQALRTCKEVLREHIRDIRHNARYDRDPYAEGHIRIGGNREPLRRVTETLPNGKVAIGEGWKLRMARRDFGPLNGQPHVGVEIECGVNVGFDEMVRIVAASGMSTKVTVTTDGSVSVSRMCPLEFRICDTEAGIADTIRKVCTMLRGVGAKVNRTCGLHVHLDMRKRDWRTCYSKLYATMPWLYSLVSESRREGNTYCKRNSPTPVTHDRYHAINACAVSAHSTLEVRLHQGSVDPYKILHWVNLLLHVIDAPEEMLRQTPKTLLKLAQSIRLGDATVDYIAKRAKFAEAEGLRLVREVF